MLVAALRGLHSSFLPLGARTDAISRGHGEYISHSVYSLSSSQEVLLLSMHSTNVVSKARDRLLMLSQ